jgi:hypothetical protein
MSVIDVQELTHSLSVEHVWHGPPSPAMMTTLPLLLPPLSLAPLSTAGPLPSMAPLELDAPPPLLLLPLSLALPTGGGPPSPEPFHGVLLPQAISRPTATREPTIIRSQYV